MDAHLEVIIDADDKKIGQKSNGCQAAFSSLFRIKVVRRKCRSNDDSHPIAFLSDEKAVNDERRMLSNEARRGALGQLWRRRAKIWRVSRIHV